MKRHLTQDELKLLLNEPKKDSDPLAQRDHHVIGALSKSGLRIQEFSLITLPDVYEALKTNYLFIPKENRKGREGKKRDHSVYVTEPLRKHLLALVMMNEGDDPHAPLVPGRNGDPLSVRSYQARLKYWAIKAGLSKNFSPHWLRHTRAMDILKNSSSKEPLRIIQTALGHTNINTTMVYLKMDQEELETTLNDTDGAASKRKNMAKLRSRFEKGLS